MSFLFKSVFWFAITLAFLPPNFRITPEHAAYDAILNLLPDHLALAVDSKPEPSQGWDLCQSQPLVCETGEEVGLLLDTAGTMAEGYWPEAS